MISFHQDHPIREITLEFEQVSSTLTEFFPRYLCNLPEKPTCYFDLLGNPSNPVGSGFFLVFVNHHRISHDGETFRDSNLDEIVIDVLVRSLCASIILRVSSSTSSKLVLTHCLRISIPQRPKRVLFTSTLFDHCKRNRLFGFTFSAGFCSMSDDVLRTVVGVKLVAPAIRSWLVFSPVFRDARYRAAAATEIVCQRAWARTCFGQKCQRLSLSLRAYPRISRDVIYVFCGVKLGEMNPTP